MPRIQASLSALLCLVSLCCGCSPESSSRQAPPIPVAEPLSSTTADKPASGGPRDYSGITYNIPASWSEIPNQTMVDSKYLVPTSKGELELTLTSMGGGIDSNIGRWVGQIRQGPGDSPKSESIEVDGLEGTLIDVRGEFSSKDATSNAGSRADWRLVGIGVPVPGRDFFVKLVGPREAVVEFYDELLKFVKSGKKAK